MKLTIFLIMISPLYAFTQKKGGYGNPSQFIQQKPYYSASFIVTKRSKSSIKAVGGSDYKIESANKALSKTVIKSDLWGVCVDSVLYLNGINLTGLIHYAKAETMGKYVLVYAAYPISNTIKKNLGLDIKPTYYFGGAIGGAIKGANEALRRVPLILNMKTGSKNVFNQEYLVKLLTYYPDIEKEYNQEVTLDQKHPIVMKKYLMKINSVEDDIFTSN